MAKTRLVVLSVICRRDATLDSDAEDRPVAIDDGDDRVVDVDGRGGPFQQGLDVAGRQHLVGFGRRGGISGIDGVVTVHAGSDVGAAGDGRGYRRRRRGGAAALSSIARLKPGE